MEIQLHSLLISIIEVRDHLYAMVALPPRKEPQGSKLLGLFDPEDAGILFHRNFGGIFNNLHNVISQKSCNFINMAVRTPNLTYKFLCSVLLPKLTLYA